MQMQLMQFDFGGKAVRALPGEDGEPQFIGKDVCDALGYADATNAIKRHCRGVAKRHPIVDDLGRIQEVRVLSEADVMRLLVHSKLPSAEAFERLVFEEILPTIRRTGSYSTQQASISPQTKPGALANDWIDQSMRNAQTLIDIALETVGEEEALRRAPGGLSRPDVAMGLAGLLLKRQRLIMEFDDVNHPTLQWLHSKIMLVGLRESDWADRLVKSLSREQIAQILHAATRTMIG